MDDLKPCPCGSTDLREQSIEPVGQVNDYAQIVCNDCGIRGPIADQVGDYRRPFDEWNALWNTHTAPTVQEAAKVLLDNTPNPTFDILKPILMSEHSVTVPEFDEDGEEYMREITVSWVVMKRIISHALRALSEEPQ